MIISFRQSYESMCLNYFSIMDWEEFNFIQNYTRKNDCAFDVGANIGIYSLWISRFVTLGNLYAFEPDPSNYSRLKRQIAINALSNIKLENLALGDADCEANFSQGKDVENRLKNGIPRDSTDVIVQVKTLDGYCRTNHIAEIDFLKLDVEGAELMIFKGATELLSQKRIKVIQFELNRQAAFYGFAHKDVIGLLKTFQYNIYTYETASNSVRAVCSESDYRQNMLAIADLDYVNARLVAARTVK